jgi:hypothetical protein
MKSLIFSIELILQAHCGLESIQPLTEMSTRDLPGGGGARPARKADNLAASSKPIIQKICQHRRIITL